MWRRYIDERTMVSVYMVARQAAEEIMYTMFPLKRKWALLINCRWLI
jgi:hypothetical protein